MLRPPLERSLWAALLASTLSTLAACNLLTGVDGIGIDDPGAGGPAAGGHGGTEPVGPEGGTGTAGDTSDPGGTTASGGAGQGGSGGAGQGGSGGDPVEPPAPVEPQVCYPGPNNDHSVCVPLVPWSASWGADYEYPSSDNPHYAAPLRFVDLSAVDGSLPIAANFVLDEVMQEYKGRYGVFQVHVVEKLQTIRDQIGAALHVNSGYRSPGYNASIDGATLSRHMYGDAADMWSNGISLTGLSNICSSLGAGYIGMYSSFVHCDWRTTALDPAFYGELEPQSMELPVHTGEIVRQANGTSWQAPATGFDEGEPLRLWTAFDGQGNVIDEAEGESYAPPAGAARIRVWVGGHVELEADLGG